MLFLQALGMLNDEMGLVSSLMGTLASFKEDPGGRQRSVGGNKPKEERQPRDPDVWPPPTPVESR